MSDSLEEQTVTASPGTVKEVLDFRQRTYMALGLATVPFLLPFSINSFLQSRDLMGLLTAAITVLALSNSGAIHKFKRPLIPYWVLYIPIMIALAAGMAHVGTMVAFWCYPVAIVTLFVCEHRQARWLILASIVVLIPTAFIYMDMQYASRFAITYLMTCYFGDLVLNLLDRLQATQSRLSITDPLTGAYNRRQLADSFDTAREEHGRGLGSITLIMLDVDHFKTINDQYGHSAGDEVLTGLAKLIKLHIRKIDNLYRFGGEEFAILTRGISIGQAYQMAEKLRGTIAETELLQEQTVTCSFGLTQYEPGEDLSTCLQRADKNLYEAKQHGRNQVWPVINTTSA